MAESTVKVTFIGDERDLKRALGNIDDATEKTGGHFGRIRDTFVGVFTAQTAQAAVQATVHGLLDAAAAAREDEAAQAQLAQTLRQNVAGATDQTVAATEKWISATQRQTGVLDDHLRPALATLLRATNDVGEAQKLTSLAMDIAQATGKDLETVSLALAKAHEGNVGGLQRLGISLKGADGEMLSFDETAKQLADTFGGAVQANLGTTQGKMQLLNARMEDLREEVGARVNVAILAFAEFLQTKVIPAAEKVVAWVQAHWPQIRATVTEVMENVRAVIEEVLGWIEAFWRTWGGTIITYVTGMWQAIKDQIEGALKIIQGVVNVIMGLIHGDFSQVWEGIKQIFSGALQFIKGLVEQAFTEIRVLIEVAMRLIAGILDAAWDAAKKMTGAAMSAIAQAVADGIEAVVGFFRSAPGYILAALGALPGLLFDFGQKAISFWWNGLIQMWGGVLDWFAGLPDRIVGAVGNLSGILYDIGRAIIQGLWDGMKSIWGDVAGWLGDIAGKIKGIKGPIDKDRVMLKDEGKAIMAGLHAGMVEGWDPVEKFLRSRNARIGGSVNVTAGQLGYSSGGGSSSGAVVMNLTVNNPTFTGQGNIDSLAFSLQKRAAVAFAGAA